MKKLVSHVLIDRSAAESERNGSGSTDGKLGVALLLRR